MELLIISLVLGGLVLSRGIPAQSPPPVVPELPPPAPLTADQKLIGAVEAISPEAADFIEAAFSIGKTGIELLTGGAIAEREMELANLRVSQYIANGLLATGRFDSVVMTGPSESSLATVMADAYKGPLPADWRQWFEDRAITYMAGYHIRLGIRDKLVYTTPNERLNTYIRNAAEARGFVVLEGPGSGVAPLDQQAQRIDFSPIAHLLPGTVIYVPGIVLQPPPIELEGFL